MEPLPALSADGDSDGAFKPGNISALGLSVVWGEGSEGLGEQPRKRSASSPFGDLPAACLEILQQPVCKSPRCITGSIDLISSPG